MPDSLKIIVPKPMREVVHRLESARMDMAPQIGPISYTDRFAEAFTCSISYGGAIAILTGSKQADGAETLVEVEFEIESRRSNLSICAIFFVLSILADYILRSKEFPETWLSLPFLVMFSAFLDLSKPNFGIYNLKRFVRNTVMEDACE